MDRKKIKKRGGKNRELLVFKWGMRKEENGDVLIIRSEGKYSVNRGKGWI